MTRSKIIDIFSFSKFENKTILNLTKRFCWNGRIYVENVLLFPLCLHFDNRDLIIDVSIFTQGAFSNHLIRRYFCKNCKKWGNITDLWGKTTRKVSTWVWGSQNLSLVGYWLRLLCRVYWILDRKGENE